MSSRKPTSPYQPAELSENRKRPTSSRSTPIACRVCDKVFFDNVSLLFHFECHIQENKIPSPWLLFRIAKLLSLKYLPYSCAFNNMNKRLRPLSVSSAEVGLIDAPVLNSVPPMNSTLRHNSFTSPSMYPFTFYSQVGEGSFAPKLSPAPTLELRLGIGGPECPSDYQNPRMKQMEKPAPEIIFISDDDEDENKGDEIDLTLKL